MYQLTDYLLYNAYQSANRLSSNKYTKCPSIDQSDHTPDIRSMRYHCIVYYPVNNNNSSNFLYHLKSASQMGFFEFVNESQMPTTFITTELNLIVNQSKMLPLLNTIYWVLVVASRNLGSKSEF